MEDIKTNIDVPININSFSTVNSQGNNGDATLPNTTIAQAVDNLDLSLETNEVTNFPNEGIITRENIDFSRISTTADNAKNGNFLDRNKINENYWGDNGELSYKIRDDGVVMLYENGALLGFTDKIGKNMETVVEKIEPEVTMNTAKPEVTPQQDTTQVEEIETKVESSTTIQDTTSDPNVIDLVYREPIKTTVTANPSLENNTIQAGSHYTTGNTTYPMSNEDLYRVISCIEGESNGTYEDALAVASVIANRIDDGRFSEVTPLGIVSHPGQFVAWDSAKANRYANDPSLCKNPEIVKAAQDVFYKGIRNNDYVEFKAASSPDRSVTGELKYQFVGGGNKFHNLAQSLDRVNVEMASSNVNASTVEINPNDSVMS